MTADSDFLYLDYAATTPLDPQVAQFMQEVHTSAFANAGSTHRAGRRSAAVVGRAAVQLGALLQADPDCFLWTSGATESNNLAIAGAAKMRAHRGKHLVTMRTEHKAVVDVFIALEKQGFEISWLTPDANGHVSSEDFEAALRKDTQLASIMHINNETGVVQDIAALGAICREHDVLFHVDGAQSVGKVHMDLDTLPVDLLSLTAHKFYGPSGIGALYIADGVHIEPLMFGGGQQRRLRPGSLPVDLIAGLGAAAEVAGNRIDKDLEKFTTLRETLWRGIQDVGGLQINGSPDSGYPGILNVSVDDVEGESLLLALEPLCVAAGSACNSQSQEPSYVLRALGRSDFEAQSAVRFSLGRPTTRADIDIAAATYRNAVRKLRDMAPERVA